MYKGEESSAANIDKETMEGNLTSGQEMSQNKIRDNDPMSGSGTKARRYLDNQWESETSNSQNQYLFGKGGTRVYGYQGSGDDKSEQAQKFASMNQTEIIRDGYVDDQVQNWSDGGNREKRVRRSHPGVLSERDNPEHYTFRGNHQLDSRKPSGPQPFTSLGV